MKIVVTVPAYNEEKTIGKVVASIKSSLDKTKYRGSYKVLVVDDGSSDKTYDVAKKAGAISYSHPKNYGLAECFRTELEKCLELGADVIVHIDADMQYRAEEIPKLLKEIEKGYDLVLGSRFAGKIESMPIIKRLGNKAFSRVVSQITGTKITDAQTGFRAFTRKLAQNLRIVSDHTYTQEQIIRAIKEKYKVIEVPIYFAKRDGKSRLISNPFGYAIRAWINIIRTYRDYEPLKLFGTLGFLIFGVGFAIGLYMVYLHFTVGISGHFALLMLDVLTLSVGLQTMLFSLIADMARK